MFDTMTRWVQRTGLVVEFGNVVGAFVGKPYRYEFPDIPTAKRFCRVARSKDEKGLPAAIGEEWRKFRRE